MLGAPHASTATSAWRAAAAPALAALAAFAWAAWWKQDVDATILNGDVLYELHRVQRCLADFPSVTSIDSYSRAGLGVHLHWMGPFTLLLACIAKLAGAAHASVRELASTLALVPPLLGAATSALMVLLARRLGATPVAATVAGLGMAFSGDALATFHHGRIDHHVFIPLGLIVAALGWASRSLPCWAVGHVLLFFMAPEATSVATLLLLVAGGSECVSRTWRAGRPFERAPAFLLAPAVVALLALLATRAIDPAAPPLSGSEPLAFSGLNVAWIAFVGGLLALAARLIERPMTPAKRFQLLVGATLALVSVMGLVLVVSDQAGSALDRILRTNGQQAGHGLSLLRLMEAARDSHWAGWASLLVLAAGFGVIWSVAIFRRRAPALDVHAAGLIVMGPLLALLDLRHARAFAPLVILALTFAAFETAKLLAERSPLSSPAGRIGTWIALALIVLPPFIDHSAEVRAALRAHPAWQDNMGALCDWMRRELPDAGSRDQPVQRAIFAAWEWGHHLNVLGDQPVIVDPFSQDEATNDVSRQAWLAGSPQEFIAAIEAAGGRHVVVTAAAASIVGLLPRTPYEIVGRVPEAPGGIAYLPALRQHFAFRLDELGGLLDESGRLMPLWISAGAREMAVLDGAELRVSRVPLARLYEIVDGAILEARAPTGVSEMEAELDVEFADKTRVTLRRRVNVGPDGIARLHVALPAPLHAETFTVAGPYRLKLGDQSSSVVVTEADVRSAAILHAAASQQSEP